jgi:hypothetical protein
MSTSIHASIEYTTKISPNAVMSFAEVCPGVSGFSNIFGALGVRDGGKSAVPKRGYPRTPDGKYIADLGWIADRQLTCLVVNDMLEDEQSSDGFAITLDKARDWIARGLATALPEAHSWADVGGGNPYSKYWRITDPDIHSVNWITADELEKAIEAAGNGYLHGYWAALAAMRVLEADENISMVRMVYGFDN